MKNRRLVCPLAAATALALSGCGMLPGGEGTKTVNIWLMRDSASEDFVERFKKAYEEEHDGVELRFTVQEWTGIGKKVTEAIEGSGGPDVIEVGNTQVAQYADTDKLYDLTLESVRDLGSEDWLPGLAEPGSIGGSQYGIPWYAANRIVIYNKDLFRDAGIDKPPATRDQWLADTEKLNKNGSQGIYLAGQDWYTLSGFIWDEGGELAVDKGGQWTGALESPAAQRGMAFYKELQSLGSGPKNADEQNPPQADVFAKGDVAQLIATPSAVAAILKTNPGLKNKLGYFPIPGKKADQPCAVFTGGSDLIIPENAPQRTAALDVVKAMAGEKWQTELARAMGYVPNKKGLASVVAGQEATAVMARGAARGRATPNSPQWANVEADNPIKPYMTAVLQGEDPMKAAQKASEAITDTLAE
ncbi:MULTISPECIES: extracellular solute-binding protein [Streptomyces]|uniref:Lipoprotein n=2 Tax=Streptomyces cinereoruber TaxID=67260 RepID=A0AAV4KS90_9ACTN|nr:MULTISPECIES: extracellular solute-binding protein [Streptomyces]KYG51334.1 sugar transporter [Streptomyces sp. WAC04657]MBB4158195.1 N,N'-diacetylchitobiose transport system substrate-binding protein [Streptomyces cinereoruber]MBY8819271.1 extracellular solute-binding protein [Streptomyces cinereoruber]NIH61652.1 N,N'-diacetylchitobiose transport system substrate-binding protein [Streptomyces cinereoruber]GGR50144.1 lipoprotein [Streptomyces cinereoruber]